QASGAPPIAVPATAPTHNPAPARFVATGCATRATRVQYHPHGGCRPLVRASPPDLPPPPARPPRRHPQIRAAPLLRGSRGNSPADKLPDRSSPSANREQSLLPRNDVPPADWQDRRQGRSRNSFHLPVRPQQPDLRPDRIS